MSSIANSSLNYAKDSYSFNFKTSSGDSISFSAYNEKNLSTSSETKDGVNIKTTELSLSAGYEFHYKGDGLDENDLKEIKQAMKNISPQMQDFMKSSGSQDILNSDLEGVAQGVKNSLPKLTNSGSIGYMKDSLVKKLDDIFKMFDRNQKSLDNTTKLLDKIFAKIDNKDNGLYA